MARIPESTQASAASSSEMSITDPSVVSKPLLKDEKVSPKPKMKKSPLKLKAGESGGMGNPYISHLETSCVLICHSRSKS